MAMPKSRYRATSNTRCATVHRLGSDAVADFLPAIRSLPRNSGEPNRTGGVGVGTNPGNTATVSLSCYQVALLNAPPASHVHESLAAPANPLPAPTASAEHYRGVNDVPNLHCLLSNPVSRPHSSTRWKKPEARAGSRDTGIRTLPPGVTSGVTPESNH